MCGLFGWKLSEEAAEKIQLPILASILALRAESRGDESWGVHRYNGVDTAQIIKDVGSITDTCKVMDIIDRQVVGHTRKATTGAVSVRNAHPFRYKGVIGAHNGWITNHRELNKELDRDFQVDSEHVIAHLAEERPLDTLDGMGTVVYMYEDNPTSLYFGRGQSSDLAIYGIKEGERHIGIIWGSREQWLDEALHLAGVDNYFEYTTECFAEYECDDTYELGEVGQFLLKYKPFQLVQHHNTVTVPVRDYRRYIDQTGAVHYDWSGPAYKDPTLNAWREQYIREDGGEILVPREGIQALPEPLKKTSEVGYVGSQQDSQASASTWRCAACNRYGEPTHSFEVDAHGIVWHTGTASYLCTNCYDSWNDQTSGYAG